MTYCVGLCLDKGLVFMSDTRTNAGVDNISKYRKMFTWNVPGERTFVLLTAGNLATTQAVVSMLEERTKAPEERNPSILEVPSMFQAARLIGKTLREVIKESAPATGPDAESPFRATLILGGQIAGSEPRLFMIYPEGNFVEASKETPFFQIGETKYGRPILVRAHDPAMSFAEAVKLLMVSFDSTLKANLSVGLPLDLLLYETDSLDILKKTRIEEDDPYYNLISDNWSEALKTAFASLPQYEV
ncbi:MAG: peptidase [Henriciella sp.]|uniref:proteasome-type protease n=1 Tax=Henriciella sp. TaxID=1968823 RepID=UPI000C0FD235|nr:proteasome-type protease [Henriciella sp.]MAN72869.1 peptidase [Henriciella sp.]MBF34369.1 peptidase [Hyphomonadaceae bacterium]PHR78079.1 MAG: peptidase [Henriciella sp.]|tara:strand:+ start:1103 stop:1837 length:735 start_codon:yes stop_codon:yes gene_type:complete